MKMINKQHSDTVKEILNKNQFVSNEKCLEDLKSLAKTIDTEHLVEGTEYMILELGKIRADKPEAYYFAKGRFYDFNKTLNTIRIYVSTEFGNVLRVYDVESLILMKDMTEDIKKMIEVSKKLDWSVDIDGDEITFAKYSPAGQDFYMTITADNLEDAIEKIYERYENFDCSEETYLWLDNTGHGQNGAPHDMKELYKDMEACEEMMKELHDELLENNQ